MVDLFFALLMFVIIPLMSVNCACSYEVSKERIPTWNCSLWGPILSMFFYVLYDIFIAEHHPHVPSFFGLILAPVLGVPMFVPSLIVVLIRRRFTRSKGPEEKTTKPEG